MGIGDSVERPPVIFGQGLFEESATAKQRLGTVRRLEDGRMFVYAKAGEALTHGHLQITAAPVTNHTNQAVAAAAAVGAKSVSVTLGATAAAANLYKDGWLHINDAAGEANAYKIRDHLAIGSGGTGWINLYDGIRTALTTSSEYSLTKAPTDSVIALPAATATIAGAPVGVAVIDMTSGYYGWLQVKGPCPCLVYGTVVIGNVVVADATLTNGQKGGVVAAADHAAMIKGGPIGVVLKVNATTEYALVNLNILGY